MIRISKKTLRCISSMALLTVGLCAFTGCSTPAYSAKERGQLISRNVGLEWQMMQDDIDNALLLRPLSQGTRWNVR